MTQPYGAVDPETAAERAHVLLESEITARLDAVRDLAKRLNDLDAAIADYVSGWQSATRAGWTESTLADIGLRSPESLPSPSGRRAAESASVLSASAPSAPSSAATSAPASPTLAPVVALAPPPAPAPSAATAPAFGPAPTLASVAPLSAPTAPASPSVVSTPVR